MSLGLSVGLASTALQLYARIVNSDKNFYDLDKALKCFCEALKLNEDHLDRLPPTKEACEELVTDIQKSIFEYESANALQRPFVALQDIESLKSRMTQLASYLTASSNGLERQDRALCRRTGPETEGTYPALGIVGATTVDFRDYFLVPADHCIVTDHRSAAFSTVRVGIPVSPCSTLETLSDIFSSPSSTLSLASTTTSQGVISVRDPSSSSSSIISLQRCDSSQLAQRAFESIDSICRHTPLTRAITIGDLDLVQQLLEELTFLEARDRSWDWTPAIWAVMEDRLTILEELIQRGADLTATDRMSRRSPLLWAASIGQYAAIELLLQSNQDLIHVRDHEGMSPLALASMEGHLETARLLLENGDDPNLALESHPSLLAWAISMANGQLASLLLDHGANPWCDADGVPALVLAIRLNLTTVVQRLLSKGVDVQSADENGVPALTVAIKEEFPDIAEILIDQGAEIEAKDPEGNTAILWAIWHGRVKLVEKMVQRDVDTDAVDGEGVGILERAIEMGNEEIIHLLKARGYG